MRDANPLAAETGISRYFTTFFCGILTGIAFGVAITLKILSLQG